MKEKDTKKAKRSSKKVGQKKVKDTDELRKLHTKEEEGHLQYVCGRVGNELESLGITHGKRTKGVKNIPLKKNPNPQDPKQAYIRPKLTQKKAKDYGKRLDGLGLGAEDKKMVWELIERLRKEKK